MLTKKQLQSELGVSKTTVFNWILKGRIPPPDEYGPNGALWNNGIADRVKVKDSVIDKGLLEFLAKDSTATDIALALNVKRDKVYYSCRVHSIVIMQDRVSSKEIKRVNTIKKVKKVEKVQCVREFQENKEAKKDVFNQFLKANRSVSC